MHRRSVLLAATALVALLATPAVADEVANIEVVKGYLAAWNAHSAPDAGNYFADDVVYYDASVGSPVNGREAATTLVVMNFMNAAPDLSWVMTGDPIADGNLVAFEWKFVGTNTGAWADGTEASGKAFTLVGASVFNIIDGRIATQSDYYDALGFYRQLGWLE